MLVITMILIAYAFGTLFVSCELGQRNHLAFNECSEVIDQFDWYLLPSDIQRMLPLLSHFSQQPVEIKCFGSVALNREH